jgi:hypothetical protein
MANTYKDTACVLQEMINNNESLTLSDTNLSVMNNDKKSIIRFANTVMHPMDFIKLNKKQVN